MKKDAFLKAGHLPTLIACFLYFDLSFAVWVLLGPLAVFIAQDLGLNAGQKGLMVALPVLAGAALRIVNGILVGQWNARRVGLFMQVVVIAGLLAAWMLGLNGFPQVLAFGIVLGVAGASFAIAMPMASYWYPPQYQGFALGLRRRRQFRHRVRCAVGADARGDVRLAQCAGPGRAAADRRVRLSSSSPPRTAQKARRARPWPTMPRLLGKADAWWLMFFYSVSFGGFVGLSSFLPIYFHDQYGLSAVTAGYFTAACVFVGSFARPFGGALADRVGGTRALSFIYALVAALLLIVSRGVLPAEAALATLMIGMVALGMGNGAVFQLVPQRFGGDVGLMSGLVGMTGGVGGFYLAASLGYAKQFTGSYAVGFVLFAALALAAWAGIAGVRLRWRRDAAALAGVRV